MTLLTSCSAHAPTRANRMMRNAFVPLPLPVRHPTQTITRSDHDHLIAGRTR